MSTVDFGLMLRPSDPSYSLYELLRYNRACIEALSSAFTTLWLEDHMQVGANDALEPLTTLSYFAAAYPQLNVGTLVLSQSYRNPALVAKMLANLQALTGGRVVLGIGAGWKEDEYRSYGYPFPPLKTRMDQLEEAVQVIRTIWSTQPATFEGKHYSIHAAYCAPQPSPPIPLLIGGGGEQRTLALVARYADWWNFNSVPVEEYARKVEILKRHCADVGRDFSTIKLTYLATLSASEDPTRVQRNPNKYFIAGNAAEVTRELARFHDIGVTHFMFRIPNLETLQYFVAHVAPHFAG
jgi:alkanesulfonate monooxygenase SsuD/methylene tetrahydromethanopterin reductase-like flavin-dependent oxidoreductase (luciferase family)